MLHYGACYYPEYWTDKQVAEHVRLMKKAQFNVVRMGEFAWCKFEPLEGQYEFDWLDSTIERLHREGISTVLCTPTCIPPMWVYGKYPDILIVDRDGRQVQPGSRCHCCKNAPAYIELCDRIVEQVAEHYAAAEGVIGWQTDNEFGCHDSTRCYCSHCERAFRAWLERKYGSVEAVNEAWGTSFWGFDFNEWDEIPLPRRMSVGPNPSHWLDFVRFSSDTQVQFQRRQYAMLKERCPDHFVTHNYMGRFPDIDYYKLSEHVDFPSWDNYPDRHGDPFEVSYAHEITRSFRGKYWVMEQKSGPTGSSDDGLLGEQPERGEIRRWAWQALANGADAVVYFRWQACTGGAEQYWHGILDHDGLPRRRFREVGRVGKEFAQIAEYLEGTRVESKVALIRDFDTLWSFERQPTAPGFDYDRHCFDLYRAVKRTGHTCDIIAPDADFGPYRVVLAPSLSIVDGELAQRLEAFVRDGGTLVLTPQSGSRTPTNLMAIGTRPGSLVSLTSATVGEVRPLYQGQTATIQFARGPLIAQQIPVETWVEALECMSAEPVAEYLEEPIKGKPAIVRNALGSGQVFYLGVYLPRDVLEKFLDGVLPEHQVKDIPESVEVTQRKGDGYRLVFFINHGSTDQTVTLPGKFLNLLSGETVGPKVKLAGNGVLLLKA